MKIIWLLLVITAGVVHSPAEELVDNNTFSLGKMKWSTKGNAEPSPEGDSTLLISLDDRNWTILEQDMRPSNNPPFTIAIRIELMASGNFLPAKEAREYSDENFAMGGQYGWSSRIFPKADCLIQVQNGGGWEYRPVKLETKGSWQTITCGVENIRSKKSTFALAFPPGSGSVKLKLVSVQLK